MTGLLGLVALPSWASPALVGALVIGIGASVAGGYAVHRWDAGTIASAHAETASLQSKYSAYEAAVAANAARATAEALSQQTALQARANDLQKQLQDSQNAEAAKSRTLQAILASGKPSDMRALGPIASEYVSRLHGP